MKKYVVWVREVNEHSGDEIMMVFDDVNELRQYMKAMQGVLTATDYYSTFDKNPKKGHIK